MYRCAGALLLVLAVLVAPAPAMTLYTSELLPDVQALVDAFQKTHPGAEVKVFRSGSGEIVAKLRAELEAHNPQADAVWIADPSFFEYLAAQHGLRSTAVHVAGYPPSYSYQNGASNEVRLIYDVIAINSRALRAAPRPADWTDLLKPAYRGLVAMPDPNYSGGALVTLGALAKRYGFGFFEKLKANGMRIERSNPLLLQKLAQGDYSVALMVDFNVRQAIASGAPLAVVYPHGGAILIPTPIGVLAEAKDASTADAFVRFLLSRTAQAIFAQRSYAPVVAGLHLPGAPSTPAVTLPSAASVILTGRDDLLRRFNALFGLGE